MDYILITSLVINVMLIVERMFKHVKKSSCFGVQIENEHDSLTTAEEGHFSPAHI